MNNDRTVLLNDTPLIQPFPGDVRCPGCGIPMAKIIRMLPTLQTVTEYYCPLKGTAACQA